MPLTSVDGSAANGVGTFAVPLTVAVNRIVGTVKIPAASLKCLTTHRMAIGGGGLGKLTAEHAGKRLL